MRSSRVASATTTVTSGREKRMKSRAISSSSDVEEREYVPGRSTMVYTPVARVLLEAGEGVEDGTLPRVGVPRQSDGEARILGVLATALQGRGGAGGARGAGGVIRLLRHGDVG